MAAASMDGGGVTIDTVQGIFYSEYAGQGKTVTLHSYYRHDLLTQGKPTRRLSIDMEQRSRQYRSPDNQDHPEKLMFAFDYFHDVYEEWLHDGELSPSALVKLYQDIKDGEFPYDVILIDNAAMFQDNLRLLMIDGPNAQRVGTELAQAFRGVYAKNQTFLAYRFKVSDAPSIYRLLKDIIEELLRLCRYKKIDVLVATESKNVWWNYGKTGMKILGTSPKILDPFMKYADFSYCMSRTTGDRKLGTAKLVAVPHVSTDTFNPKNSLPGLPPAFEFTWSNFWSYVLSRKITTQEELDGVEIAKPVTPSFEESPEQALQAAKEELLDAARFSGKYDGPGGELDIQKVKDALARAGLKPDDALSKKAECLAAISGKRTGVLDFDSSPQEDGPQEDFEDDEPEGSEK